MQTRLRFLALAGAIALLVTGCSSRADAEKEAPATSRSRPVIDEDNLRKATFAGGCFWCMEPPFEKLDGVAAVVSGFSGGPEEKPSYNAVAGGRTGHTEAVQIHYDPAIVSYEHLLEVFWRQINPTDPNGQFVDRGSQYRPEIFAHDVEQVAAAKKSKAALGKSKRFSLEIVVPVTPFTSFYPAEKYHQDYYKKSSAHYKRYRRGSGRDAFINKHWGDDAHIKQPSLAPPPATQPATQSGDYRKPSDEELQERLTTLQYRVTQHEGTEMPFRNEYWDNKKTGLYVDIVSGEPLFSSTDKFKSGTGWPSFTRPLPRANIVEDTDHKLGYARTEVRSRQADSHLGHLFKDGPAPTGLRYCINSAALRFIPVSDLEKQGYDEFKALFEKDAPE